jgi:uncharacterized membrane protein
MEKGPKKAESQNIFIRMHPVHRVMLSATLTLIAFFLIRSLTIDPLIKTMILWDVFAVSEVITSWIVILMRSTNQIKQNARIQDGSLVFVFALVLISSLASMFTVFLLIISKDAINADLALYLAVAIGGMLLSWILVHTLFTFHYARIYYKADRMNPESSAMGLSFPKEDNPDYRDFAYFAFVVGMTFQVSDVEVCTRQLRRVVLFHGLLSFALNTFVVALTVNLIGGLKN